MRGRRIGVTALLVVATLLTTAFGFALWAKRQALDTNHWVDTSSALLEDEDIRQAIGLFIIDRLYQSDEVQAQLEQVLPPRLAPLAKPAAAGLSRSRSATRGACSAPMRRSRRGRPRTGRLTRRCLASSTATPPRRACRSS